MTAPTRTVATTGAPATSPTPSVPVVTPGGPMVARGEVFHCREHPARHEFRYPVSYVWLDPDDPDSVCRHHPAWSARHVAPSRFRPRDYGDATGRPLGEQAVDDLVGALGRRPSGPIRMLTQFRRWGWLFNPITVYVVWDGDGTADPVGGVLEVTNTPWKERHRYPIVWQRVGHRLVATTDKVLHVSPFLDEDYRYSVSLSATDGSLRLGIDVTRPGSPEPVLTTLLDVTRRPATRATLGRALRDGFPTHRVSAGIHRQALALARKRVPFVPHPRKRST